MFMYAPQAGSRPEDAFDADDDGAATRRRREVRRIVLWRYRQARLLGAAPLEARLFAESDGDLGELRGLARAGCPPRLAIQIVV